MSDLDYIDQSPSRDWFKYLRPMFGVVGIAVAIGWAILDLTSLLVVGGIVAVAFFAWARGSAGESANTQMVCPHCHKKGTVHLKSSKVKRGISGGKATAGILTWGWSLFVTGLSRKEKGLDAHCTNCGVDWRIAGR